MGSNAYIHALTKPPRGGGGGGGGLPHSPLILLYPRSMINIRGVTHRHLNWRRIEDENKIFLKEAGKGYWGIGLRSTPPPPTHTHMGTSPYNQIVHLV